MSDPDTERRSTYRQSIALSAVVKGRESEEDFWKEETELVTVSRLGASFNIPRECGVGRIVAMIIRMPEEFRCYDQDKKLYRIWGLVQHCSPVNQNTAFQVGIAFIGKFAPESYLTDPLKTYRIVGMDEDGLWNVGETKAPFVSRSHHRFPAQVNVRVALLDAAGEESTVDTEAVTENISEGGASVFSTLEVDTGGAVKFFCEAPEFASLSVIRNRQRREGGRVTLHLQFTENDFPVMELKVPYEEEGELFEPEADEQTSGETEPDVAKTGEAADDASEEAVAGTEAKEEIDGAEADEKPDADHPAEETAEKGEEVASEDSSDDVEEDSAKEEGDDGEDDDGDEESREGDDAEEDDGDEESREDEGGEDDDEDEESQEGDDGKDDDEDEEPGEDDDGEDDDEDEESREGNDGEDDDGDEESREDEELKS